ncbi:MAG: hypothetical protein ACJAV5_001311 [Vicingaceae bacterium]|jgi:hypothetical protein
MKFHTKAAIVMGLFYAAAMASWDYHDGADFNPFRFLLNFIVLGSSWFVFEYWQLKKKKS